MISNELMGLINPYTNKTNKIYINKNTILFGLINPKSYIENIEKEINIEKEQGNDWIHEFK